MQSLDELVSFGADVELLFSDGSLMASSTALGLFSSVLRGAVEANAGAAARSNGASNSNSNSNSSSTHAVASIPVEGITKAEWLEVASFWYPIVPAPTICGWVQAELLLKVAVRFDIATVLHKVDLCLQQHAGAMTARLEPPPPIQFGTPGFFSTRTPAFESGFVFSHATTAPPPAAPALAPAPATAAAAAAAAPKAPQFCFRCVEVAAFG
jgi:hypothetical protein